MGLRDWFRPPRHMLPLFLAVTVGSATASIWLGWRFLDLDRALARQQVRDRLEHAADAISSGLDRELDAIADRIPGWLASPDPALASNDALVVALIAPGVEAHAGAPLLYAPAVRVDADVPASTWTPGEIAEFRDGDYGKAAAAFNALARSRDARVRAGALLRLARNLRKGNRPLEALDVYAELANLDDAKVGGEPAALAARQARCRLLRDLGRVAESHAEAAAVLADLERGRWSLERTAFLFHRQQAKECEAGASTSQGQAPDLRDRLALATAIDTLWREWREGGPWQQQWRGRRSLWIDDRAVLLVWDGSPDRMVAFAAVSRYLVTSWQRVWMDQRANLSLVDGDGHSVLGATAAAPGPETARMATDTRLPWTVRVTSAEPDQELAGIARRRRLLVASLGLVAFLVLTGSYFVARAIQRELAVSRLQSDFVSAVSHEFRTPLTSIRHLTDLLKNGQVGSEERRRQYYDVLASETERLHRFVETLLNFGGMEAGAKQYRFEKEEAVDVVQEIVDEFRAEPASQRRRITVSPNRGLPPAWLDREAFARALWNLLDNAAKYSADDAPIEVQLQSDGNRIAISVRDRGPGIPAAEHERIFQKFVRGAGSRESGVKGTGVGLAIVRHVVRAHGGDVRVTSDVGQGSTFTIVLPTAERHA